tara:strand:+ start:90 stop:812 length:723 start_codon:yes stop_codon:yes gene_type:complete
MKKKLGVNIDHVATIRNARGEDYPDPMRTALLAQKSGADSITIHLREDRRHINDSDLRKIKSKIKIPLNLEMAATKEMLSIALRHKPKYVCIVPEKRAEITTEGGLKLNIKKRSLKNIIAKLKMKGIRVTLFIEPKIKDVILSKALGSNCVELHTGSFCNSYKKKRGIKKNFIKLKESAKYAKKIGLQVHAGHGLTYNTTKMISKINYISEFNIGHFIVSESMFIGLKRTIKRFNKLIGK